MNDIVSDIQQNACKKIITWKAKNVKTTDWKLGKSGDNLEQERMRETNGSSSSVLCATSFQVYLECRRDRPVDVVVEDGFGVQHRNGMLSSRHRVYRRTGKRCEKSLLGLNDRWQTNDGLYERYCEDMMSNGKIGWKWLDTLLKEYKWIKESYEHRNKCGINILRSLLRIFKRWNKKKGIKKK